MGKTKIMYCIKIEINQETDDESIHKFDWYEDGQEFFREARLKNQCRITFYEEDIDQKFVKTIATYIE